MLTQESTAPNQGLIQELRFFDLQTSLSYLQQNIIIAVLFASCPKDGFMPSPADSLLDVYHNPELTARPAFLLLPFEPLCSSAKLTKPSSSTAHAGIMSSTILFTFSIVIQGRDYILLFYKEMEAEKI